MQRFENCPFCGKEAETPVKHFKVESYNFIHRCPILGPIQIVGGSESAIAEIWNTRVDPQRQRLVDALKSTRQLNLHTYAVGTIGQIVFDEIRMALKKAGAQ